MQGKFFACLLLLNFSFLVPVFSFAAAEVNESVAQVKPDSWKANFSAYYYDFEGKKAARGDLYGFGGIQLQMEIFSLHYLASPEWTFGLTSYYQHNTVVTQMGGVDYKDRSEGIGDTTLSAIHPLTVWGSTFVTLDLGLSIPTGSISEKNPNTGYAFNYPYNMQMGSGTFDPSVGITFLYYKPTVQIGSRFSTVLRTGEQNKNGYHLGNVYRWDGWLDYPLAYGFTPRLVGYFRDRAGIAGKDNTFGRIPLTEYYHHDQVDWNVSAAIKYQYAMTSKFSLVAEAALPLVQGLQNYDEVIVDTNYYGSVSVAGSF